MQYTYSSYCAACLAFPLFIAAFLLWLSLPGIYKALKQCKSVNAREGLSKCAAFFLVLYLASMQIGVLKSGGIWLLTEREHDAVETSGSVERIELLTNWQFNDKYGKAVSFQVDGETFRIFSLEDVQQGDEVEIVYLPKSRYVLQIKKLEGKGME